MERCRSANWARGYFWDKINTWKPERFGGLPRKPLCDFLRRYAFEFFSTMRTLPPVR